MNIHKFNVKPKTIPPKTMASAVRGNISSSKSKSYDLGNF